MFHRTGQQGEGRVNSGGYNYLTFWAVLLKPLCLIGRKKNNPLCQPFVARSVLFPSKPKENGQDSFCPESICVFYLGLGFEGLIVKVGEKTKIPVCSEKSKEEFLKPSRLTHNSPGWLSLLLNSVCKLAQVDKNDGN